MIDSLMKLLEKLLVKCISKKPEAIGLESTEPVSFSVGFCGESSSKEIDGFIKLNKELRPASC